MDDIFAEFEGEAPSADFLATDAEDTADFLGGPDVATEEVPAAAATLVLPGYLPGYGPPPSTPPPSYAAVMEMKQREDAERRQAAVAAASVARGGNVFGEAVDSDEEDRGVPPTATVAATQQLGLSNVDEWELVVLEKKGYGVLISPVPPSMDIDETQMVVDVLAEQIPISPGRIIFLRKRKMAFLTLKKGKEEQAAIDKAAFQVPRLGGFSIYSRELVFGSSFSGTKKQETEKQTGAYNSKYNGPQKRSVTPLSLSSSESSSTDSDLSSASRERRRKKKKQKKKQEKRRKKEEKRGRREAQDLHYGHPITQGGMMGGYDAYGWQVDPWAVGMPGGFAPPPPPARVEYFLIEATRERGPKCGRCRENLRESVPEICPMCGAPLRAPYVHFSYLKKRF